MLSIGLISLLIAVPLFSYRITPSLFNRITIITLIYSSLLAYNSLYVESLGAGVGIYSGLFHVTTISVTMESFLFMVGALAIIGWAPVNNFKGKITQNSSEFTEKKSDQLHYASESSKSVLINKNNITIPFIGGINEYSIMVLFTTIGAALLVSSSDLISMYLSIELQSFAVYILATLYRDSESATAAGLKYFLLGGLSSALILLGTALIYSYTGVTQFESIYAIVSVPTSNIENVSSAITAQYPFVFGLTLIGVGFLFKVAAAPFHNWAPDVYNGVPTIVTTWLTTMPKISIFVFLLELQTGAGYAEGIINISNSITYSSNFINDVNIWKNLLLVTSLFSLVIGTVVGLSQQRIKRLLAYSTISHVGFLLLALSINTEQSIESFLFYIIQYSITNVNTFIIILAFGYIISASSNHINSVSKSSTISLKQNNNVSVEQSITDIQFISELKGQFSKNPVLSLSFALCLFSIAGIPPLIGFFAKQMVLYSSTYAGYNFISIIAIIVSVISASYYLKIIKVMYFDNSNKNDISTHNVSTSTDTYNTIKFKELNNDTVVVSNVHSMIIAIITMVITLFVLQPSILLNSCHLLSLSLFNY